MSTPSPVGSSRPPEEAENARGQGGGSVAPARLMVGAVLFANDDTLLLTDRTLFVAPPRMHLPAFHAGSTVVVEYETRDGRNVLTHVPAVRL